ncbi:MAG: sodium-dependent transporter [Opitutales bacterium]
MEGKPRESWNTRIGVILAVAGSAVGLGNFLRFPGLAAQYGGGAFMVAYFISFLLIGLPICWAEWTMGRMGGRQGGHSAPAILGLITRKPALRFMGVIGVVIPVCIYMYYVVIEAWCLAYAVNYLGNLFGTTENLAFRSEGGEIVAEQASDFFVSLTGLAADGAALRFDWSHVGFYVLAVFIFNFVLIYRGISKGIEWFCRFAMPLLVAVALIVLVRVLTLGTPNPDEPSQNISNGLGFLWNPNKVMLEERVDPPDKLQWDPVEQLFGERDIAEAEQRVIAANQAALSAGEPDRLRIKPISMWEQLGDIGMWNAAAGQIFFTLSVGFGVIITYASYLRRDDDVVLSGMAASSANEFCEVGIGGLLSVPAGVAFFGSAFMLTQIDSTFSMGFNVLPLVFASMPGGMFFGFLFFFLLFLAAVTSSISMLQPGIAFLEDSMGISRRQSVAILGLITAMGTAFVAYFSGSLKALDTIDYWVANLLMVSLATIQIIIFAWVIGIDKMFTEAHQGASVRIPEVFRFIMKWVSPTFLLLIFGLWFFRDVLGLPYIDGQPQYSGYVRDLVGDEPNKIAWLSIALILAVGAFVALAVPSVKALRAKYSANIENEDLS